jgi:C1A family cysteine protease
MRKAILASSVALGFAAPAAHVSLFEDFVQTHGRKYSSEEKDRRLNIFSENMKMIEESNSKNLSYTLGVTPYTDLTFEEFRARFIGGLKPMSPSEMQNMTKFVKSADFTTPESVDWVKKGAVSSVKNQGHCGSCWTFSAAGALEGAMVVAGRKLVDLSEQELVDCDTGLLGGHGCSGGNPAQAFGWVKKNGMCALADYPYVCMDQSSETCKGAICSKDKCKSPTLKAGGWFTKGDVTDYGIVDSTIEALEEAVARQPISVGIEADQPVYQHYKSGVITDDACGQQVDHGVLAVGYGTEGSTDYWLIKNSWGADWGDKGFVKIARGKSADKGECGIRTMASYATVAPASDAVVV